MNSGLIIAVFGGSAPAPGDPVYEAGVEAGELLAQAGFRVATGGYGGIMEAAAIGATRVGGEAIGVTAPLIFPDRDGPNRFITSEVPTSTLSARIHEMVTMSAGSLALPGSIGTLAELVIVWNSAFVTRFSGEAVKPVATVGDVWAGLVAHVSEVLHTDSSLVSCHNTVPEAVAHLVAQLG